jgi:hypothetical protein
MLLAVHNGAGGRQLQESQLKYPLPAAVLLVYPVRLCRQIGAFSYGGNNRSSFVGCGASVVRSQRRHDLDTHVELSRSTVPPKHSARGYAVR